MDQMKEYRQLIKELPSKTVVFAFGRFNPPTIGHELLIKAVKRLAQQKNADHVIYASKSQDSKKNPLSVDKKVKYLNLMFRNTHFTAANENARTFIEAAKELNKRYKNIVMVAGSDRVPEFKRLLNTYNGKDFNFDTIEVISAGERDPDADDATGMSASKMRAIAAKGNYAEFKKGLPSTVRDIDGKRLMNDIREGMGLDSIKEQIVLVKDDLREKYFRGEIYNEGDLVESGGETYTIVKRGSNHLLLKESSGKLVSKWIHDVQPKEEENMNEELTQKTLRTNDKIKVARVIATMLGVDNAETSSNPDNLVNLGLRKVRSKALNPEAIAVVKRMLELANSVGIKYDKSLLPSKLKEGVIQPNGTDKVEPQGTTPVIPKEIMRFNDYKKGKVGSTLHNDDGDPNDDQVRKMKIKHHLGEKSDFNTKALAKQKLTDMVKSGRVKGAIVANKLRSITAEETELDEEDAEKKEVAKANLAAKHATEKEALSAKHTREKEALKEDIIEIDESSDAGLAAKAEKSGVSIGTLRKVYKRGVAAWNSGHRPGTTPQQWGMARVNSYITKGKGTYHGADKDLREEEQLDEISSKLAGDYYGAAKSEEHHDKAMKLKEETQLEEEIGVHRIGVTVSDPSHPMASKRKETQQKFVRVVNKDPKLAERVGRNHFIGKGFKVHDSWHAGMHKEETEQIDEISAKLAGNYYGAATKKHIDKVGVKPNMYGRIEKDMGRQRKAGVDRAMDRIMGNRKTNEELEIEEGKLPEVPKDKESGLPKKYVAGLSASTAKARAAHFDKMDKKNDSDPSAYAPAPGDDTAKTKESKHTKKYRQMYGEDMDEEIYEACWDSHKQVGLKKKGNRMVPDCVPKNEQSVDLINKKKAFDPFFENHVELDDYEEKWEEHIFADDEPSEEEIEHFINHISDDDIYDLYDEDELTIVDDDTGEELPEDEEEKELDEGVLFEVLSRVERMKAKFRIRRTKAKRARATKIALKRFSNTKTINKRSRRLAIKMLKKRLLRGRDLTKLSVGEKERVDRIIQQRKPLINRLAMRLIPRIRKVEKARMSHGKVTKGASNVAF